METWLQPNRRALACAAVLAAIVGVGGALAWGGAGHAASRGAGAACVAVALGLGIGLWRHGRRPRIACDGQHVLFYVRGARPVAVPLRAVEAFFLGQGPAHVPLASPRTETVNLVTRLSQKFPDLARGAVKPALAQWCDHYLTLRGAWCEPLTGEVVRRLNRRLREVQQTAPAAAPPREGCAMTRGANEFPASNGADLARTRPTPRLLVSVRNLAEAEAALDGGADWIDLKEPAEGPLGAPAPEAARRTVAALAGRVPWSAAAGELRGWDATADDMLCDAPAGYVLKLGLAGCGVDPQWTARWRTADVACRARGARLAAVSYADWQAAQAPPWDEVAAFAIAAGASYWLIDTFDKRAGGLFAHVTPAELSQCAQRVRAAGLAVAVAGSLTSADVPQLPLRDTDLVAIRTAACAPDRWGTVDAQRVRAFRTALVEACRAAGVACSV